jgi:energy-coupling factor transporter ATP-binding protein EcfA2
MTNTLGEKEEKLIQGNYDASPQTAHKQSQADIIYEMIKGLTVVNDIDAQYVQIPIDDHTELYPLMSRDFMSWVTLQYYELYGTTPSIVNVRNAINLLSAFNQFGSPRTDTYNRVARCDESIIYDLTNDKWQAVNINKSGWNLIPCPPFFRRYTHCREQITPISSESTDIDRIFNYINIKNNQRSLFVALLVSYFIPDIPHPVMVIYGERGSGKSTASKIVKEIVDPSILQACTIPQDKNDMYQLLHHHWYVGFDNITALNTDISDIICRAVTGEGIFKRKLFSDSDDITYSYRRCIGLNGTSLMVTREDLLDRSLLFELERIEGKARLEERSIWPDFERNKAYILGSVFTILSRALSLVDKIQLDELPRMADFAKWGFAITEAIKEGTGKEFIDLYNLNINMQNEALLSSNPLLSAIYIVMSKQKSWHGSPTELYRLIQEISRKENINTRSNNWPKEPNQITKKLNELRSILVHYGIDYNQYRTSQCSMIDLISR